MPPMVVESRPQERNTQYLSWMELREMLLKTSFWGVLLENLHIYGKKSTENLLSLLIGLEQLNLVVGIFVLSNVYQIQYGKVLQTTFTVDVSFVLETRVWIDRCSIYLFGT